MSSNLAATTVSAATAAAASTATPPSTTASLIDVAVNLTDCVFVGVDWKNKIVHPNDFGFMMKRSRRGGGGGLGVSKCLISGTSLVQCARAIRLCRQYPNELYCTIGVHPANSSEFLAPLSAVEREYVEVVGGLRGRGGDAPHETQDPLSLVWPPRSDDGANSSCGGGSSIPHYTIGSPLRFDDLPPAAISHWEAHRDSPYEAERLQLLEALIAANSDIVAAVGECGLDGAELAYCPYSVQERYFIKQLRLSQKVRLPLFLHSRDCGMRFANVFGSFVEAVAVGGNQNSNEGPRGEKGSVGGDGPCVEEAPAFFPVSGVVHSFTGDTEELAVLLSLNTRTKGAAEIFPSSSMNAATAEEKQHPSSASVANIYIGLNGSAFRTEDSARRSVTLIPSDRLVLETDAPWCDIRKDNFGAQFIKTNIPTIKKEKAKAGINARLAGASEASDSGEGGGDSGATNKKHKGGPIPQTRTTTATAAATAARRLPPTAAPLPPCIERRNEPCFLVNVLECLVGCRKHFGVVDGTDGNAHDAHDANTTNTTPNIGTGANTNGDDDAALCDAAARQIYANTIALFPILGRK